jgi:signal transduction histidine kinase
LTPEFFEIHSGNSISRLQQRARVAENYGHELERLALMQLQASRNYYRLLEAHDRLRARTRPERSLGTILADSLDAERKRLGRELHTGVGQALAGIHIHVKLAEAQLPELCEPLRQSFSQITMLAATALEQVRGVSRRLYIPAWQSQPLLGALRSLWEASGISATLEASIEMCDIGEPPLETRRAIYLVAQEGISNVIQHADASRVRMTLRKDADRFTLEIEDNGSRLAAAEPDSSAPSGIGLRSMRDLARELGGDLELRATAHGSQLTLHLPVIE